MIGQPSLLEFHVLLQRVYSSDLGKHVEAGTILLPMAVMALSYDFIIMNEKAWSASLKGTVDVDQLDVLRFSVSSMLASQVPMTRSLGPTFKPENPFTEEEIKMFRLLYEH